VYNNVNLNISIVCSFFFVDFHLNDSFILKNFNTQNNFFFPFYVKLVVFNSFMNICVYIYIYMYTRTYIHTYISRAHTYMHTCREIVTHTYMSRHIYMREHMPHRFNVSILMIYYNNSNNNRYGGGNDDYKTLTTKIIKLPSFFYLFLYNII